MTLLRDSNIATKQSSFWRNCASGPRGLAFNCMPTKHESLSLAAFCGTESAKAWRRQTGDVPLPGFYAQLRENSEGTLHGAATDDTTEVAGQAASLETRAAATHAHAHSGTRNVSALGLDGSFPLLRGAHERPGAVRFSPSSELSVADGIAPS